MNNNYTGRQIAIFTDSHALLGPTKAVLEDIKKRGIYEVYSLGDNIGVGPNPADVLDLLGENNVKSLNGNSEEYSLLGIEPFMSYFTDEKIKSQDWTYKQLKSTHLDMLKKNTHSLDLVIGGKKVGFCHFANDVRIDFSNHSTWSYQAAITYNFNNPQIQFYYTNCLEQKNLITALGLSKKSQDRGFVSCLNDPLFGGKKIEFYDEIFQGHTHYKLFTEDENVKVHSIRAVGMGFRNPKECDLASYIIIKERQVGFDIEEVFVPYDRDLSEKYIAESDMPIKEPILKFTRKL